MMETNSLVYSEGACVCVCGGGGGATTSTLHTYFHLDRVDTATYDELRNEVVGKQNIWWESTQTPWDSLKRSLVRN